MSEYAAKVADQVHHKFELLGKTGADFGLVFSEFTNGEEFCRNFDEISSSRIVLNKHFIPEVLKKVITNSCYGNHFDRELAMPFLWLLCLTLKYLHNVKTLSFSC